MAAGSDYLGDLFGLEGKVALVTGGTSGIGRHIAEAYLRAGASVYVSSRKADACEQTQDELSNLGRCVALPADLSREKECERLATEVGEREPHLHILVNNAGVAWGAPLDDHDASAWDRVLDVNLKGPFHLIRFLHPRLAAAARPGDPARVINVGSTDGLRAPPMESYAYTSSKAALHHLTRHLANRLAPAITVNAIAPGAFESRMTRAVLRSHRERIVADTPLRSIGGTEDIAGAAVYLASNASAYVTGSTLVVDGGLSIASRHPVSV